MNEFIIVKGAREHNLKNISVKIPKNKLVVFSGVSGSGKSSLAIDTLYAEGQRRYVESLSSYARQFLGMMRRPEVESIEGLSPSIAITQHGLSHNPRSTVGTVTEIYDYLRVLFARIGHPHCPQCGQEVAKQTAQQIAEQIRDLAISPLSNLGTKYFRFMILSPVVRDKRGEFSKLFENLENKGFRQVRIDGKFFDLGEDLFIIKTNRHNIDLVVDRLSLTKKDLRTKQTEQRLLDAVEIALEMSNGLVIFAEIRDRAFALAKSPENLKEAVFSTRFACPKCNLSIPEVEPRLFSFNSPFGACGECNGLGVKLKIDTDRVSSWKAAELEHRYYTTTSDVIREEIEKLMIKEDCPSCQGARLKPESLSVTVTQHSIAAISSWSLDRLCQWVKDLANELETKNEKEISRPVLREIANRLSFLISVGVSYLTLDRGASSLSVGEAQRIRLASQVGSGLTGVLYILDEPTVGLHPKDIHKLIDTLKKLRDLGNTVIVVEHDPKVMEAADWIIDFGPKAGKEGGQIVAESSPLKLKKNPFSLTGRYLAKRETIPLYPGNGQAKKQILRLENCTTHNLKNINADFPLGKLICVSGVSGSGKSSLLTDTLYPALKKELNSDFKDKVGGLGKISGSAYVNQVLLVDQSPIGRTCRSNPATYIGVFTDIRHLFAQTRESKLRGFSPTHFSFNTEGGRCEACQGQGLLRVNMQFLPDIWVECEQCHGLRFKAEVLEVEFKEKNIAQILAMTIKEAKEFFGAIPAVVRKLELMEKIGLDYLELGQPSPTLSGGESQRLKLARELVKKSKGRTVYILDEPTTGLHFDDLKKLLFVLRALVNRGDTVIVIEHNLEVLKQADWIIDLGPEGGQMGGEIIAAGPPAVIVKNNLSWTGKYLKPCLVENR